MIDIEALRKKIIELGIRGHLTEQLSSDGNAKDLYIQIQHEKTNLIKEGKLKKEKKLPNIELDEIPFEIPQNWTWAYLGEIFCHTTGKALNNSDKDGIKLEYITTSNMYWDHFEVNHLKSMYFKESELEKCTIKKGDLLICEGGDIGRSAIWPFDYEMRIQNHIHKLRGFKGVEHKFYYYVMRSYKDNAMIAGRGMGLQGFSSKRLHSLIVPLPPHEEQIRIIKKLDDILTYVNIIDSYQQKYEADRALLKCKIIDAGIQGKLTEQLLSDGNADALCSDIKDQKTNLIKEGKLKKEKKLPNIELDEIPFEIPQNWKWVRLRDICKKIVDGDHNPPAGIKEKTEYLMLSAQNINEDKLVNINSARYLTKDTFIEENKRTNLEKGDILLTIVATLGRSCVFQEDLNVCFQRSVCVISTFILPEYLKRVFDSTYIQKHMYTNATGTAQPGFYLNKVEKMCIPVPPLDEQNRIINKINELLQFI